ncbi:MAG: ABC transporter permease [Bacteroidaceae bacterium]|nr:ABC transporter permease [Bacteroidaceae bacterium]
MKLSLFIARRLYGSRTDKSVSRPAIHIATIGIAIGLAVMLVSVAVVLGFKSEIKNKLTGFGADIQVINMERPSSYESLPIAAPDSLMEVIRKHPQVAHAQRYVTKPVILKTDDLFRGIGLKGVGKDYDWSFLRAQLVEGEIPAFSDTASTNRIVISRTVAREMKLKLHEKVYCYMVGESLRARRFEIAGIYETHLAEFDGNLVFTDRRTVQRLNDWDDDQVTGVEVRLKDYDRLEEVYRDFVLKFNTQQDEYGQAYYATTIEKENPALFAWLGLLDLNVWVILALMLAVAGFTMISGLLIIILERTNMIGVLKALGADNDAVRHIFLYFAVLLIGRGMVIGNVLGLALCWLQKQFALIPLDAASYYVDVVPIEFNWPLLIALNVGTLLVSVTVLLAPSYLVSQIHPARSIRFE